MESLFIPDVLNPNYTLSLISRINLESTHLAESQGKPLYRNYNLLLPYSYSSLALEDSPFFLTFRGMKRQRLPLLAWMKPLRKVGRTSRRQLDSFTSERKIEPQPLRGNGLELRKKHMELRQTQPFS